MCFLHPVGLSLWSLLYFSLLWLKINMRICLPVESGLYGWGKVLTDTWNKVWLSRGNIKSKRQDRKTPLHGSEMSRGKSPNRNQGKLVASAKKKKKKPQARPSSLMSCHKNLETGSPKGKRKPSLSPNRYSSLCRRNTARPNIRKLCVQFSPSLL